MVRTGGAGPGAGPGEGKEWEEEGSRARPDFQSGPGTCGATPDAGTVVEGGSMGRMRKRSCVASPAATLGQDGPWAGVCPAPIRPSWSSHRLSGAGRLLLTGLGALGAMGL